MNSVAPCLPLDPTNPGYENTAYLAKALCPKAPPTQSAFWVVPTARRKRAMLLHFSLAGARFLPRIQTFDQFMGEIAAQGDLPGIKLISETERALRVADAWRKVDRQEPGPGLTAQLDRVFRDMRAYEYGQKVEDGDTISRAYETYHKGLVQENRADRTRLLTLLTNAINEGRGPAIWLKAAQPLIFFDGFHWFQPIELGFIHEISHLTSVTLWLAGDPNAEYGDNISRIIGYFSDPKNKTGGKEKNQREVISIPSNSSPLGQVGRSLFHRDEMVPVPPEAGLKVLRLKSRREEMEWICATIKEKYRQGNYRLSDVAVVVPDNAYDALVREIFTRSGLPFNLAGGAFPLLESRPARVLHSALHLIREKWRQEELEQFLHQPLVLNKLKRAYFLKGFLQAPCHFPTSLEDWKKAWNDHVQAFKEHKEKANEFLQSLFNSLQLVHSLEESFQKEKLREVISSLGALLEGLKIGKWISGDINKENELIPWVEIEKDQHAWTQLTSTLTDLASQSEELLPRLFENPDPRERAEAFLRLLDMVLGGREFQIKADDSAGVQVLGAKEIRGMSFAMVFVPGLVAGAVPKVKETGALGRFRENRASLKFQFQCESAEQKWLFTQLFEAARENLFLSFPTQDEDQQQVPSRFLMPFAITDAPPVAGLITQENLDIALGKCLRKKITPPVWPASALTLNELERWQNDSLLSIPEMGENQALFAIYQGGLKEEFSPSQLEEYSACPFKYFARRALKIETFEDSTHTLYGKFVHKVFHRYYQEKRAELNPAKDQPLSSLDAAKDRDGLIATAKGVWLDLKKENPLLLPDYLLNLFLAPNGKLDHVLQLLKKAEEEFGFILGEWELGKEDEKPIIGLDSKGRDVRIFGRVDRIDGNRNDPNTFALLDYKTGKREKNKLNEKLQDGRLLQLPLYAKLVEASFPEKKVDWARYLFLGGRESKNNSDAGEFCIGLAEKMGACLDKALSNASAIRQGLFPLTTISLSAKAPECTSFCDLRNACRNKEGFKEISW